MKNKSSFVTYIDESGDEGFLFQPDGSGSSRWLVLTALIINKENDLKLVTCLKEVRSLLKMDPKKDLHFHKLSHEKRVPYIKRLCDLPIKTVSVLIHKPSIVSPDKFQNEKFQLYLYGTKLLLERVSWYCRDDGNIGVGDGFTDIIFSNRCSMSYEKIKDYLRDLLQTSHLPENGVQLSNKVIDPNRIVAVQHSQLAGLQAVDAIASGVHWAIKINPYGETEPSYYRHIQKTLYCRNNKIMGYGLKLWPKSYTEFLAELPEIENLKI